jgi:hypothetical protein
MTRPRRVLRLVVWAASSCIIAILAFIVASYSYGFWYATRTDAAQHEVWSAYLRYAVHQEAGEATSETIQRRVIVIRGKTNQVYRPTVLAALLEPRQTRSDHCAKERAASLPSRSTRYDAYRSRAEEVIARS